MNDWVKIKNEVEFMNDWVKIKNEYVTSNISHRDLAKKHGVSAYSVSMKSSAEGWVEERKKFQSKSQEKAIQKAAEKTADTEAEIAVLKAKTRLLLWKTNYEKLEEALSQEMLESADLRRYVQNYSELLDSDARNRIGGDENGVTIVDDL